MKNCEGYKVSLEDIEKAYEIGMEYIYVNRLNFLYDRLDSKLNKLIFFFKENISFKPQHFTTLEKLQYILEKERKELTLYKYETFCHCLKSFLIENFHGVQLMKKTSDDTFVYMTSKDANLIYDTINLIENIKGNSFIDELKDKENLLKINKNYFLKTIGC